MQSCKHFWTIAAAMLTAVLSAIPTSACTIYGGLDSDGLRNATLVIRANVTGYKVLTPRRIAIIQIEVSERLKGFAREGKTMEFLWESPTAQLPNSWEKKSDVIIAAATLRPRVSGAGYKIIHSACHAPGIQEFSGRNVWNIMKITGD